MEIVKIEPTDNILVTTQDILSLKQVNLIKEIVSEAFDMCPDKIFVLDGGAKITVIKGPV